MQCFGIFKNSMPYNFSRQLFQSDDLDSYDVKNLTEMSNKFLDLPISKYIRVKRLYEEDKNEFYKFANEYILGEINDKSLTDIIHNYITKSHIVNARKDVLATIIKHFENKDFISVVNILPMQIEGMFHDICLSIGVSASQLDISSINEKMRLMQKKFNHYIYFEYYSFKFPVIRNAIAHGKPLESNIEHTAIMLMLDLIPVFELSLSDEIPINKKISLLEQVMKGGFNSLIEFFYYTETEIPDFYNKSSDVNKAEAKYNDDEFWSHLEERIKLEELENINNSETVKFIRKLNYSKLCQVKVKDFLKRMPSIIEKMRNQ